MLVRVGPGPIMSIDVLVLAPSAYRHSNASEKVACFQVAPGRNPGSGSAPGLSGLGFLSAATDPPQPGHLLEPAVPAREEARGPGT